MSYLTMPLSRKTIAMALLSLAVGIGAGFLTMPMGASSRTPRTAFSIFIGGMDDNVSVRAETEVNIRTMTCCHGKNWGLLRLGIDHTNSTAQDIQVASTCSYDGITYYPMTTTECKNTNCNSYVTVKTVDVTGDAIFLLDFDVRGCECTKFFFAGKNATIGDTVTARAILTTGF